MNIRLMTIDDYEQVYALWANTLTNLNDIDDSRERIAKYLERNPTTSFVAEKNDKIIGAILSGHDGRRGFIGHTAVATKDQRKGVGNSLVKAAMTALKNEGINKVAVLVLDWNENSNSFWGKQGFSVRQDLIYRNKLIN